VEYGVEDLVLTAEAGLGLVEAQRLVADHHHTIPLSPPLQHLATVGGVTASAAEGPTAARYGRVRDQVLGLRFATSDGRISKIGGRVVKNVTGYDLNRLLVGSCGSLAVLLEVTLRLRPTESFRAGVAAQFDQLLTAYEFTMCLREQCPSLFAVHVVSSELFSASQHGHGATVLISVRGDATYGSAMTDTLLALLKDHARAAYACSDPIVILDTMNVQLHQGLVVCGLPSQGGIMLQRLVSDPRAFSYDGLTGQLQLARDPSQALEAEEKALAPFAASHRLHVDRPGDPSFHGRVDRVFGGVEPRVRSLMSGIAKSLDPRGTLMPNRRDF
jgi:hypothetical protein